MNSVTFVSMRKKNGQGMYMSAQQDYERVIR